MLVVEVLLDVDVVGEVIVVLGDVLVDVVDMGLLATSCVVAAGRVGSVTAVLSKGTDEVVDVCEIVVGGT